VDLRLGQRFGRGNDDDHEHDEHHQHDDEHDEHHQHDDDHEHHDHRSTGLRRPGPLETDGARVTPGAESPRAGDGCEDDAMASRGGRR
jgi:hypothetical protein